ncbi:hypothetical protein FB451DRAFT_1217656 [Mycena latifolia]|nr:hypothetical protein FB451DRAFT_1217656 [Mycena latifolia]
MFAKSAIISLALVAVASPVLSAPLPVAEVRDLEARLSLPEGALGSLIKSLGKGILSGGAVSGLLSLLGEGDDSSSTPASRDLEARGGLASILEKLVGAGEESLESVLKNAIIGGVASGAAVEGVNAAAGQSSKRGIPAAVVDDAAKVAEKTIGSVIGDGVASGIGSAVGGLGIGAIISKLFGSDDSSSSSKRGLADLSDEEVNTLLEYINEMNGGSNAVASRTVALGSVGKGIAGLVAGLAATQGAESAIEEIKSLFRREASFDDLD